MFTSIKLLQTLIGMVVYLTMNLINLLSMGQ